MIEKPKGPQPLLQPAKAPTQGGQEGAFALGSLLVVPSFDHDLLGPWLRKSGGLLVT